MQVLQEQKPVKSISCTIIPRPTDLSRLKDGFMWRWSLICFHAKGRVGSAGLLMITCVHHYALTLYKWRSADENPNLDTSSFRPWKPICE